MFCSYVLFSEIDLDNYIFSEKTHMFISSLFLLIGIYYNHIKMIIILMRVNT